MRPLSAADCFTPALERAKAILLPFNWRLWLKLGLVALLAEIGAQFMFPPTGGGAPSSNSSGNGASPSLLMLVPLLIVFGIIVCTIGLVLFYIGSRMQMVFMEIAATRQTLVAPLWQRHRFHVWRWIGLKLLFFFSVALIAGLLIAAPLIYVFGSIPTRGTQLPPAAFGTVFLLVLYAISLVVLALALLWLLRDFVLPFIIFQDATLKDSISYAIDIVRREPGAVLLFLLLKLAFALAASIALQFALLIAALAGALPLGLVGGGLWMALRHADTPGTVLLYFVLGVLGVIFLVWILFAAVCAFGATQLFLQAYALYFLGGRYPLLGHLLEPPRPGFGYPPPPPAAPPVAPGWAPST